MNSEGSVKKLINMFVFPSIPRKYRYIYTQYFQKVALSVNW